MEIKTGLPTKPSVLYLWAGNWMDVIKAFRDDGVQYDEANLCSVLNLINDQNITSVDLDRLCYTWNSKVLSLDDMSTAEKMFMATYLAVLSCKHIDIVDYPDELTTRTSKRYIGIFGKSDVTVYIKGNYTGFERAAKEVGVW